MFNKEVIAEKFICYSLYIAPAVILSRKEKSISILLVIRTILTGVSTPLPTSCCKGLIVPYGTAPTKIRRPQSIPKRLPICSCL